MTAREIAEKMRYEMFDLPGGPGDKIEVLVELAMAAGRHAESTREHFGVALNSRCRRCTDTLARLDEAIYQVQKLIPETTP